MDLLALAAGLEGSAFGAWARGSAAAYPAANLVHLLGLVMLVGAIGFLDLRLLGGLRRLPLAPLAQAAVPIAAGGLVLMAASGFVMFAADAGSLARSGVFRWKLAAIVLGLANVAVFHLLWRRKLAAWGAHVPAGARAAAAVSLGAWLAAAALGRLIAYV